MGEVGVIYLFERKDDRKERERETLFLFSVCFTFQLCTAACGTLRKSRWKFNSGQTVWKSAPDPLKRWRFNMGKKKKKRLTESVGMDGGSYMEISIRAKARLLLGGWKEISVLVGEIVSLSCAFKKLMLPGNSMGGRFVCSWESRFWEKGINFPGYVSLRRLYLWCFLFDFIKFEKYWPISE